MSTTPQDQPPYGAASPQAGSPQPAYGARSLPPEYGAGPPPEYGAPPLAGGYVPETSTYASWGHRVLAFLLDALIGVPFVIVMLIGIGIGVAAVDPQTGAVDGGAVVGLVMATAGWVGLVAIQIWNRVFRQGRTGQSWGKTVIGITLIAEQKGEPVGPLLAFVREVAHLLDGIFYLGYLWPLWDAKRQTFADKLCSTVVLAHPPEVKG